MGDYSWPGNVRQLESAIERAILLCEGDQITVEDLPSEVRQDAGPANEGAFKLPAEGINFEDVERHLIMQAMEQTDCNITKSASCWDSRSVRPNIVWRNLESRSLEDKGCRGGRQRAGKSKC